MSGRPINPGQILTGSLFSEPMRVETVETGGSESWVVGLVGAQTERFRRVTLTTDDLKRLTIITAVQTLGRETLAEDGPAGDFSECSSVFSRREGICAREEVGRVENAEKGPDDTKRREPKIPGFGLASRTRGG